MKKTISLVLAAALSQWAYAADSHSKKQTLDAHVHGVSELTIAIEGKALQIEFESPAMNLVGFEHKAKSSKDKEAVKKAVAMLKNGDSLFSFSEGDCTLVESTVDASGLLSAKEDHDHHKEHDHEDEHNHEDKHAHKDKHDHEDKHEHHHDHGDHDSETHSEIVASYFYECKDRSNLTSVSVGLFQAFPGIYEINAMWVSESKQGAVNLTAKSKLINFR